jgi:hypothetical protein
MQNAVLPLTSLRFSGLLNGLSANPKLYQLGLDSHLVLKLNPLDESEGRIVLEIDCPGLSGILPRTIPHDEPLRLTQSVIISEARCGRLDVFCIITSELVLPLFTVTDIMSANAMPEKAIKEPNITIIFFINMTSSYVSCWSMCYSH